MGRHGLVCLLQIKSICLRTDGGICPRFPILWWEEPKRILNWFVHPQQYSPPSGKPFTTTPFHSLQAFKHSVTNTHAWIWGVRCILSPLAHVCLSLLPSVSFLPFEVGSNSRLGWPGTLWPLASFNSWQSSYLAAHVFQSQVVFWYNDGSLPS